MSALSATGNKKEIVSRYKTLEEKDLKALPLIVESKITELNTKDLIKSIEKIAGEKIYKISLKKKKIRSGRGKRRGRKYKSNAGILIVIGKKENMKTKIFSVKKTDNLGILDLAEGGPGRITMYTEEAIKNLGEKYGN